jgi:hypothetical protein
MRFLLWLRSLWPFGGMNMPERRRGMRFLTWKNAARAAVVIVAAYLLLSVWSALRPAHSGPSLFGRDSTSTEAIPVRAPYEVVHEGETRGSPNARLDAPDTPTAPVTPAPPVARQKDIEPRPSPLGKGQRITISGGSEGVHMRVEPPPPTTSSDH